MTRHAWLYRTDRRVSASWLRLWIRRIALPLARLAVLLFVAAGIFGTPYVRTAFECRYPLHTYGACEIYGLCEYRGVQGRRLFRGGQCSGAVRMLPLEWDGVFRPKEQGE